MNIVLSPVQKNKLTEFIFFSNCFYGICAVALSMEAVLQLQLPLNSLTYYAVSFLTTVLYYGYPYVRKCSFISSNPRTNWYSRNYRLMRCSQVVITIVLFLSLILFFARYYSQIINMSWLPWGMIILFPLVAALYYGINFFSAKYNIRKIGWLKPFIIGFTWAGLVTVYPVLVQSITSGQEYVLTVQAVLLFLKNLMFVALLCVMFDFKDYASDYVSRLRTFVVGLGLRKTIFYILVPLALAGLLSFIVYALTHHFHQLKVLLNIIPFILLIMAAFSFRRRRSLMYYLVIIDGLMLVKAICGILAMEYF